MPKKSFYKQTAKVNANSTTTVLEIEKPAHFLKAETTAADHQVSKFRWYSWVAASLSITLLGIWGILMAIGWWYIANFESVSQVKVWPLIQNLWEHRQNSFFGDQKYKTMLLLGLDQSTNQRQTSLLVDTIMVGIINSQGKLKFISIPRDLWIDSLKTKINSLYYYGQQTNPDDGVNLIKSVTTEISGLPIDYYVMINMDTVKAVIDAVNGIDVTVENSFEDNLYPREIDINSKDPKILYETVRFDAGLEHMNGDRALKYIRSRHSNDTYEGTDAGRERRQQVLLSCLRKKLTDPQTLANPVIAGQLYRTYNLNVQTNLPITEIFQAVKQLVNQPISIETITIPVKEGSGSGLIYHPPVSPLKQWVYLPVDSTWSELRQWFDNQL